MLLAIASTSLILCTSHSGALCPQLSDERETPTGRAVFSNEKTCEAPGTGKMHKRVGV